MFYDAQCLDFLLVVRPTKLAITSSHWTRVNLLIKLSTF